MKPIPEKFEEFEILTSFAWEEDCMIILEKLRKEFPNIDFEKSDTIIKVATGLDDKNWGILYGFCLAWRKILRS